MLAFALKDAEDDPEPLMMIGMTADTLTRLMQGHPITLPLKAFGAGNDMNLVIFYGTTPADLVKWLRSQKLPVPDELDAVIRKLAAASGEDHGPN